MREMFFLWVLYKIILLKTKKNRDELQIHTESRQIIYTSKAAIRFDGPWLMTFKTVIFFCGQVFVYFEPNLSLQGVFVKVYGYGKNFLPLLPKKKKMLITDTKQRSLNSVPRNFGVSVKIVQGFRATYVLLFLHNIQRKDFEKLITNIRVLIFIVLN